MTFLPDKVNEFLKIFEESKQKIRSFEGCSYLELLNDLNSSNIFFTYSHWDNEEHLNAYRNSELFNSVWVKTTMLFSAKAEAWSMERKEMLK